MPDLPTFGVFSLAALALLVIPGPSVLYIVTRSVDQGRAAGLVSVLGIHTGSLVHITAAALGISAILRSSSLAFHTIKYVGAAYLVFLGVRRLLNKDGGRTDEDVKPVSLGRIYGQGVIVNVLNPKTALFFFAFLPQFVDPSRGSVTLQIMALGLTFIALGFCSDGTYALVAAHARETIARRLRFGKAQRVVTGSIFIGLGVVAALSGSRSTS